MPKNNPVDVWESLHELTHLLKTNMLTRLHQFYPELSFIEMRVITMVGAKPGITQKELIEKSHINKAQMARLLANMETLQWLTRHPDAMDKRIRRLALSHQGNALYTELQAWREELAQETFDFWSPSLKEAIQASIETLKNK